MHPHNRAPLPLHMSIGNDLAAMETALRLQTCFGGYVTQSFALLRPTGTPTHTYTPQGAWRFGVIPFGLYLDGHIRKVDLKALSTALAQLAKSDPIDILNSATSRRPMIMLLPYEEQAAQEDSPTKLAVLLIAGTRTEEIIPQSLATSLFQEPGMLRQFQNNLGYTQWGLGSVGNEELRRKITQIIMDLLWHKNPQIAAHVNQFFDEWKQPYPDEADAIALTRYMCLPGEDELFKHIVSRRREIRTSMNGSPYPRDEMIEIQDCRAELELSHQSSFNPWALAHLAYIAKEGTYHQEIQARTKNQLLRQGLVSIQQKAVQITPLGCARLLYWLRMCAQQIVMPSATLGPLKRIPDAFNMRNIPEVTPTLQKTVDPWEAYTYPSIGK